MRINRDVSQKGLEVGWDNMCWHVLVWLMYINCGVIASFGGEKGVWGVWFERTEHILSILVSFVTILHSLHVDP